MVWYFLLIGVLSGTCIKALAGIRATDAELLRMANVIGTKDPRVARMVCWILLVLFGPILLVILFLLAKDIITHLLA